DSVIARPMATIFFWPPERKSPRRLTNCWISGKRVSTRSSTPLSPAVDAALPALRASDWLIRKFSATVRSGKIPASSGEQPIPASARRYVGSRPMSCPLNLITPLRTGRRPMMESIVVVLPAPLRPTRHTDSASPTVSDTPCRTWAGPRKVLIPSTSSIALGPEEIGGHLLVGPDLVRGAVGEDRALVHGDDPSAVPEDHVHVVLDDDGGDPSRAHHRGDDVHDRRLLAGAHAARRLVEEEQL